VQVTQLLPSAPIGHASPIAAGVFFSFPRFNSDKAAQEEARARPSARTRPRARLA
jgi:hypothetical protein